MVSAVKQIVKRISAVLLVLLVIAVLTGTALAAASHVIDDAALFSADELATLDTQAVELGQRYQMDIHILTIADAAGKSSMVYADDYYDQHDFGVGSNKDGLLFLIDLDNREIYLSTSGSAIQYLTDQRISDILDAAYTGGLADSNFVDATQAFLNKTAEFLAAGIPSNQRTVMGKEPNRLTWLDSLVSLAVAIAAGLGVRLSIPGTYKGHSRPSYFDFRTNSLVSLGQIADQLLDTRVTSRPLPRPQASGGSEGRSTVHRSGGGRIHGGGGRKF